MKPMIPLMLALVLWGCSASQPEPAAQPVKEPAEETETAVVSEEETADLPMEEDPDVLYGTWTGVVKIIELDTDYGKSESRDLKGKIAYDENGRAYMEMYFADDDAKPMLFYWLRDDGPDGTMSIAKDWTEPVLDDGDGYVMDKTLGGEDDEYYFGLTVNDGHIVVTDHDYTDSQGNKYELQFDFDKDTTARMD